MQGVIEIIEAKRDGKELTPDQISTMVRCYTDISLPDYQMSSFLMAVVCRGMTGQETVALTAAMLGTGEILDLSEFPGTTIDKHSTGGVGDKVSLALVPILAAAGLIVPKMSGRGLGHTGGTLDKLESIIGYNVNLTSQQILNQLAAVGACLCAQTEQIVPADKKIYALRDVTGTVESIPLIASSIMSKKLAGGADVIVLDVKVGTGAFMKDIESARLLAKTMITIGKAFGKTVVCELSQMDNPIGQAVGNLIEVKEAADLLRNKRVDPAFRQLVIDLTNRALSVGNSSATAEQLIDSGSAWQKFNYIVAAQSGSIPSIDRWNDVMPLGVINAASGGYVTRIDAEIVGRAAMRLGAGRMTKDGTVDPLAGIWLNKVVGDLVTSGDTLATLYGASGSDDRAEIKSSLLSAFSFGDSPVTAAKTILETIGATN